MKASASPLVSIITISKDDPAGLVRSIASARGQTFVDYEHIIVRSGTSKDAPIDADPRVKVLNEPANGISIAFNSGLRIAQGEWIQFLNGGDSFESAESLQELVAGARADVDLVCAFAQVLSRSFTIPRRRLRPGQDRFIYASHQATLFRRTLFDRHGLFAPEIRIHMDLEWLTRLPSDTPFEFVDKIVIHFDPHGVSATHVVRSSIEEAGILWHSTRYRYRAPLVLFVLLPFRVLRREFRRWF